VSQKKRPPFCFGNNSVENWAIWIILPYLGHFAGACVPNTNPGCGGVAAAAG